MEFQGKTAVVTGTVSGMGYVFTREFTAPGGRVLVVDPDGDRLRFSADALGRPDRLETGKRDARQSPRVRAACERAVERSGSIDLLVRFAARDRALPADQANSVR